MGWMTWAAVAIRSLGPRRAIGRDEAEIAEAVTIQLDDSEDSSFFGRSLVSFEEAELSEPTAPLHDLFDEDDEDLGLAFGPERDYTTLSEQTARALANEQRGLSFDSLITLSDEAARALGQHRGDLSLNRLTRLSYAAAKALGQHTGYLSLWGLTKLSGTTARALAAHKGSLCFRGLSKLCDEAAKALAQHEGGVHIWNPATISDEVAKTLRANPKIFLPEKFW
jgi:hypothetical protein